MIFVIDECVNFMEGYALEMGHDEVTVPCGSDDSTVIRVANECGGYVITVDGDFREKENLRPEKSSFILRWCGGNKEVARMMLANVVSFLEQGLAQDGDVYSVHSRYATKRAKKKKRERDRIYEIIRLKKYYEVAVAAGA